MSHKPYPKYKPSEIEWLGIIPSNWIVLPAKRHFDIKLGKMLQNTPASDDDQLVPYLKAVHVLWGSVGLKDLPEMWANPEEIRLFKVKNDDLLVCEGGEVGRAGIVTSAPENCIIQNALHRVRARNSVDVRFLMYTLHAVSSAGWFDVLCNRATIAHFTGDKFADLRIPLPTLDEQRAIAAFLDRETARIDRLIEKKERQIELLQEKRTALISHAVTRGLDPNVGMKDSGIDWLGEIPEHWDMRRLKYIATARVSSVDKHTVEGEQPVRLCNYIDVYKNDYITPNFDFMEATATPEEVRRFTIKEGDVLVTKDSEEWNDIAVPAFVVSDIKGVLCGYHLAQVHSNPDCLNGRYLFRAFAARGINDQFRVESTGITRYGLSKYGLDNALFPVPPLDEQRAIAAFLDRETARIDALILKVKESIDKLREYRTAIISAAVTGKIDVREKPLPHAPACGSPEMPWKYEQHVVKTIKEVGL